MKNSAIVFIFCSICLLLFASCAEENAPLLGIRVNVGDEVADKELPYIIHEVFADSPAANAGLCSGDIIVQINDVPVEGLVNDYIYHNLVLGKKGTPVTFRVQRGDQYLVFNIIRGKKR